MNTIKTLFAKKEFKEPKEIMWSFVTKLVAAVLFFALDIYLARKLGVEYYGSWAFLFSNLTIVALLSYFGLNSAARAFVAQHNGEPTLRGVMKSSLVLRVALSAGFAALFALVHRPLAALLEHPELSPLFLAAAPLVFLMGFVEYFKEVFTGLYRLRYHVVINTLEYGLKFVLTVAFLGLADSLRSVVNAFTVAVLVAAGAGLVFFGQFYRANPASPGCGLSFVRPLFEYSLPLFFISLGFLVVTEVDTMMLGLLSTDREVGLFSVGNQISNKLPQIAFALSMGMMPAFARLNAENAPALRKKFRDILKLNTMIFVPIGFALIFLSPVFIPLIYSRKYVESVLPLQLLTPWIVMSTFNVFFNVLLDYQGRAVRRARNFALTMLLSIALNFLWIPKYGAAGAAFSTSLAYAPYLFFNWLEVRDVLTSPDRACANKHISPDNL